MLLRKERSVNSPALGLTCDVSDSSSVESAVAATLQRFGGLDAVHNNAGLSATCFVFSTFNFFDLTGAWVGDLVSGVLVLEAFAFTQPVANDGGHVLRIIERAVPTLIPVA
jgi:NAD(P)-dependent dehydrogenase (short-subunit alcohol dehydrogenase family)